MSFYTSSAGIILFFECKDMAIKVQDLTNTTLPEYKDFDCEGYGEHVSTVVVNLNQEVQEWREQLTDEQLQALKVTTKSTDSVMMSNAIGRVKNDLIRFPPVALIGLEPANPGKGYMNEDFSLFCGKIGEDNSIKEGALRELLEESTIRLHPDFIVEGGGDIRRKLGVPDLPLDHQLGWGKNGQKMQHLFLVIIPKTAVVSRDSTGPDGRHEVLIVPE